VSGAGWRSEGFCPYRGLLPYEEADRDFFKGRAEDADLVVANLYASSFTVLYGGSGVGKTSVIQAEVIPRIRAGDAAVALFRQWQPGFQPLLRECIRQAAGVEAVDGTDQPFDRFVQQVARAAGRPLFLVFDQFEEYFLYHAARPGPSGFEAELARAINQRGGQVNFLVCLREEGLAKLDRFRARIPHLMSNLLRLEPLDLEGARQAITGPLATYNEIRRGAGLSTMEVEEGLVARLLESEVAFESSGRGRAAEASAEGDVRVELPFLQLVLTRLWAEERRAGSSVLREATLRRLGGASGVVRRHLDAALAPLSPRSRKAAARAFGFLVTPSGTKVAHTTGDLATMSGLDESRVEAVVTALSEEKNRILKRVDAAPGPGGEARFEIAHDKLAPAVLDWKARYERRRQTRLVAGAAGLALVVVVLGVAVFNALQQKRQAEEQRRQSEARSRELAGDAFGLLDRDAARARLRAGMAAEEAPTPQALDALRQTSFRDRTVDVLDPPAGAARPLRGVAFSPDGQWLAASAEDGTVRVWKAAALGADTPVTPQVMRGPDRDTVYALAFTREPGVLATGEATGAVRLWRVGERGPFAFTGAGGTHAISIAVAPDGAVYSGTLSGHAQRWDPPGRPTSFSPGPQGAVTSVDVNPASGVMALGHQYGIVTLHDRGGALTESIPTGIPWIYRARFSPDGRRIAVAGRDSLTQVRTLGSSGPPLVLVGHDGWVHDVAWAPDGRTLATASHDGVVRLWDAATGQQVAVMNGHRGIVHSVAFSPRGDVVASAGADGRVRLWRAGPAPMRLLSGQAPPAADTAGGVVATVAGGRLRVTGGADPVTVPSTDSVRGAVLTSGGRFVVASVRGGVDVWEVAHTGKVTRVRPPEDDAGGAVYFTPDHSLVVHADAAGGAAIYACEVCRLVPSRPPPNWRVPAQDLGSFRYALSREPR
jgi:WD40 repeat protein